MTDFISNMKLPEFKSGGLIALLAPVDLGAESILLELAMGTKGSEHIYGILESLSAVAPPFEYSTLSLPKGIGYKEALENFNPKKHSLLVIENTRDQETLVSIFETIKHHNTLVLTWFRRGNNSVSDFYQQCFDMGATQEDLHKHLKLTIVPQTQLKLSQRGYSCGTQSMHVSGARSSSNACQCRVLASKRSLACHNTHKAPHHEVVDLYPVLEHFLALLNQACSKPTPLPFCAVPVLPATL